MWAPEANKCLNVSKTPADKNILLSWMLKKLAILIAVGEEEYFLYPPEALLTGLIIKFTWDKFNMGKGLHLNYCKQDVNCVQLKIILISK